MIKVLMEGETSQVKALMYELQRRPQIECVSEETVTQNEPPDQIQVTCWVKHHPGKGVRTVQMALTDGGMIQFPMLDLVHTEIEEGVTILSGRVFDLFA